MMAAKDPWLRAQTGRLNEFRLVRVDLCVRIDIDPNDAENFDDAFTLFSTDEARTYECTLTVADDRLDGDDCVDLIFEKLVPGLSYTLEIRDQATDTADWVFKDVPYDDFLAEEGEIQDSNGDGEN